MTSNITTPHDLLFIPGLLCDTRFWRPYADELDRRHPGHYRSQIVEAAPLCTFDEIVQQILNKAPDRFGLIGHSLGGYLALEIMSQAPERVSCLVIANSSPFRDRPEGVKYRQKMIDKVASGAFDTVCEQIINVMVPADKYPNDEIRDKMADMAANYGAEAFANHQKAIIARRDHTDILGDIACPTLLICGTDDVITPPSASLFMHEKIDNSQLAQLEGAGHMAPMEVFDTGFPALLDFIDGAYSNRDSQS